MTESIGNENPSGKESMKGMVVAPQPLAPEEGAIVLRKGGNAVDSAVTAVFVQGVVDPLNCGIGGFGTMHIHMEEQDEEVILDFNAKAGSKATPDMWLEEIVGPARDGVGYILRDDVNEIGYQSIGVPGTVQGLYEALTRYGTWTWEEVLSPAIKWAREGYSIPLELALEWRAKHVPGRPDALARFTCTPAAAKIYTKGGRTSGGRRTPGQRGPGPIAGKDRPGGSPDLLSRQHG